MTDTKQHQSEALARGGGVSWFQPILLGLLYTAAIWGGIRLAYLAQLEYGSVSIIWVPTGVVVGTLLVAPRWAWPILLFISSTVYVVDGALISGMRWTLGQLILIAGFSDAVRLGAAALFSVCFPKSTGLGRPTDLVRLIVLAIVMFGLGAWASVAMWHTWAPQIHFWREVQLWWFSDVLGCVVLVPWVLCFFGSVEADPSRARPYWRIEALAILTLIALFTLTLVRMTGQGQPIFSRPYIVYPLLIWSGLRFGLRVNATALLLVATLLSVQVARGLGPFVEGVNGADSFRTAAVALQAYLLITGFTVLMLSLVRTRGRRTEGQLRQSDRRYRGFMRISGEGVWRAELDPPVLMNQPFEQFFKQSRERARLAECNPAFAQMYHLASRDAVVGKRLQEVFSLEDANNHAYIRRFFAGGCRALSAESRRPMPDGSERWYISSFAGEVADGRLHRLWGTLTDITEQRRLHDQLREAQKHEAVGQLAGGVAHDFNNLLSVISAHTELVQNHAGDDPRVEASLTVVQEAVDRAAGVSRSLMSFGQQLPTRREPVAVSEVIEQTGRMLGRTLASRVTLKIELPGEPLPIVRGDATQLQQVLLNLTLNARDAIGEASGMITLRAEAVAPGDLSQSGSSWAQPGVRLTVADTGAGMSEGVRRRLFEPFFTTKGDRGGTGLGLSVVQRIVSDHGGAIRVSTQPGTGTTFTLELPAEAPTSQGQPAGAGQAAIPDVSPVPPGLAPILLAEDDPQVRAVIAGALTRRGYEVTQVSDGLKLASVYDEAVAQGRDFSLIITDVDMPGRSGWQVLGELRQRGRRTPAIVISGTAELDTANPPDDYTVSVPKPFSLEALCRLVHERTAQSSGHGPDP